MNDPSAVDLDRLYPHLRARYLAAPARWGEVVARHLAGLDAPAPAYPSRATQAKNLAGAAVRFVGSGLALVSQAEYGRRRAICEACPLFDAARARCRRCGCSIAMKPWMKSESCPDGRW